MEDLPRYSQNSLATQPLIHLKRVNRIWSYRCREELLREEESYWCFVRLISLSPFLSPGKRFQWDNLENSGVCHSCLKSLEREKLESVAGRGGLRAAVWEVISLLSWGEGLFLVGQIWGPHARESWWEAAWDAVQEGPPGATQKPQQSKLEIYC